MKNGIFLSFFIFMFFTLHTGCKNQDVIKEFDLEVEFVAFSTSADFNDTIYFDASAASSEINTYSNSMTKIEIKDVTATINAFNGPSGQTIVSSMLMVEDQYGLGQVVISTINDLNISAMPEEVPVPLSQIGSERFAELIKKSPHKSILMLSGSTDSEPVDFKIKFKFQVKMTANPL